MNSQRLEYSVDLTTYAWITEDDAYTVVVNQILSDPEIVAITQLGYEPLWEIRPKINLDCVRITCLFDITPEEYTWLLIQYPESRKRITL